MGSGVMTNLVIAFLLFAVVFMGHGTPTPSTKIDGVSACVIAVTKANADQPPRACRADDPVAPAKKAGLLPGDRIVAFNGSRDHATGSSCRPRSARTRAAARSVTVERDGQRLTVTTNTTVSPRPDPSDPERITKAGFLGVSARDRSSSARASASWSSTMADGTWETRQGARLDAA